MQKCLTLGKNLGMLPSLAKVEQRVAGRPRAKFSENVFILRGERRRNYIRYFKVCIFKQRVNYSVDENLPKKSPNFGGLPTPLNINIWLNPPNYLYPYILRIREMQ